ncbi:protein containing DUF1566 [Candidatus Magnetobacterium bavaricum]|uniref:Protein containing DUF1566 n=1 Tax=Candidatus Magnetobacterium bavaricum TaxID=29290 RepID=A0A0F3GWG6_9BACT|nr:protein containing DUF1566 [Candidatus Magnetobacterium bavaricum]
MDTYNQHSYTTAIGTACLARGVYAGTINLPQTGQSTTYAVGDDGAILAGVAWPEPRFTDNGDGTVTDNPTGLMWTKDANLAGTLTWQGALNYVASMNTGGGTYGYTDWRLPNINELESLVDRERYDPSLPSGHPFTNVHSFFYWSSTTLVSSTSSAWLVGMDFGTVFADTKSNYNNYVWPVRAGQ